MMDRNAVIEYHALFFYVTTGYWFKVPTLGPATCGAKAFQHLSLN